MPHDFTVASAVTGRASMLRISLAWRSVYITRPLSFGCTATRYSRSAPIRTAREIRAKGARASMALKPATAIVDPGRALIDYRHWDLLSANGVSFRWDQSYGPLSWPQKGTLLLEIASDDRVAEYSSRGPTWYPWRRLGEPHPGPTRP